MISNDDNNFSITEDSSRDKTSSKTDINIKNALALQQFRALISKENSSISDSTLNRFLVARSYNVESSNEMLNANLAWRKANNLDNLKIYSLNSDAAIPNSIRGFQTVKDTTYYPLKDPNAPTSWKKFYPFFSSGAYHHADKEGNPVYIERLSTLKGSKLVENCTPKCLLDYHIHNVEFMSKVLFKEQSEKLGIPIYKHTIIFDVKGFGLSHLKAANLLRTLSDVDKDNFPETLHKIFIVNAPTIFSYGWKLIKGWVDQRTLEKVFILGSNPSEVASTLKTYIDEDKLPNLYGGNCTCVHMVGGCVPDVGNEDFVMFEKTGSTHPKLFQAL